MLLLRIVSPDSSRNHINLTRHLIMPYCVRHSWWLRCPVRHQAVSSAVFAVQYAVPKRKSVVNARSESRPTRDTALHLLCNHIARNLPPNLSFALAVAHAVDGAMNGLGHSELANWDGGLSRSNVNSPSASGSPSLMGIDLTEVATASPAKGDATSGLSGPLGLLASATDMKDQPDDTENLQNGAVEAAGIDVEVTDTTLAMTTDASRSTEVSGFQHAVNEEYRLDDWFAAVGQGEATREEHLSPLFPPGPEKTEVRVLTWRDGRGCGGKMLCPDCPLMRSSPTFRQSLQTGSNPWEKT